MMLEISINHRSTAQGAGAAAARVAQPLRPPSRRLNVWAAYRLGFQLKSGARGGAVQTARTVAGLAGKPKQLARSVSPIDYVRYREFDFALRAVQRHAPAPRRVLDISSPKLLPLTLARQMPMARVHATDVLDKEVNWVRGAADRLGLGNVRAEPQDARSLTYQDGGFDLVTSISVLEHIAPEIDGELPAVREISRVLAPGGTAVLTVPFSRNYFADYVTGAAYERTGAPGERLFFQRFYDYDLLMRNIVRASGLELAGLQFIEERYFLRDPRRRMAHYINSSPRQNFWFGPFYPLLSHMFLSPPKPLDRCRKPYLACIVLRKPA
jgi:SAM-dependent methyltransferase